MIHSEIKIGPYLTVCNQPDYVPNMQDAYSADNERGAHWLNNEASEKLNKEWPTLLAMATMIEKQRDTLLEGVKALIADINNSQLKNMNDAKQILQDILKETTTPDFWTQ